MKIQKKLLGKPEGDFRPTHFEHEQGLERILRAQFKDQPTYLVSPRCVGGTKVVFEYDEDRGSGWLRRTRNYADGAVVCGRGSGVVIFNADCPLLAVRSEDRLGVFHCGLSGLLTPSILNQLPRYFEPRKIEELFFGWGARSCCYGLHQAPEETREFLGDPVQNGPRRGQPSIDLFALAKKRLTQWESQGLNPVLLEEDSLCTACNENYHSNLRETHLSPKNRGRNASVFWLE